MEMTMENSGMKGLNINIYKCPVSNMSNFHSLEVVGRVSKTQLQVGGSFTLGVLSS